jgi:hypothetical protein
VRDFASIAWAASSQELGARLLQREALRPCDGGKIAVYRAVLQEVLFVAALAIGGCFFLFYVVHLICGEGISRRLKPGFPGSPGCRGLNL